MTLQWKLLNSVLVLLPKVLIWLMLVSTGFHFLMETSGIMDLVINCMALKFVLSLDELVFSRMATHMTKYILEHMEDLPLFHMKSEDGETLDEAAERFRHEELSHSHYWTRIARMLVPKRLIYIFLIMAVFLIKYYRHNCDCLEDGSCVSKPIYEPVVVSYNPLAFFADIFQVVNKAPTWTMPPS
eukprot:UN1349